MSTTEHEEGSRTEDRQSLRLETLLAQAGTHYAGVAGVSSRDVVPPLHLATTYERGADGLTYPGGFVYSRHANPTRSNLEAVVTQIEKGAEWTAAFASGMAAANAILQAFAGNVFLVIPNDLYHGVRYLVMDVYAKEWGLPFVAVDMSDGPAVEGALRVAFAHKDTSRVLLWLESPSNPLLQVADIPAIVDLANILAELFQKEVISVADITWLTPYLIQPLELGVDLSLSSATKYMGGHSDLLAGVVSGRRAKPSVVAGKDAGVVELEKPVRAVQTTAGAVLSPFEAFLLMRGLRTLACRMRVHCDNALQLARCLAKHPAVDAVHYPGLPSHPGHAAFTKMLSRDGMYGAMISLQIKGGKEAALRFLGALRVFRRATSLGSTESLIEHRASVEGPLTKTPDNLVRVSVGVEALEDLRADLEGALDAVRGVEVGQ